MGVNLIINSLARQYIITRKSVSRVLGDLLMHHTQACNFTIEVLILI